jgi:hypothetical protein
MKTFNEYFELKETDELVEDISAAMINCGIEDFEQFLGEWLYHEVDEQLGEAYLNEAGGGGYNLKQDAFGKKKGFWGNMWDGIKGAGQAGAGAGAAGVGGAMGGAMGGTVGAAKGAFGQGANGGNMSVQGGAEQGSVTGRGWMGKGMDAIKGAWGNRHDANLTSVFTNARKAVSKLAAAVSKHPNLSTNQNALDKMQKLSNNLERQGRWIEKAMAGGGQQSTNQPNMGQPAPTNPQVAPTP